MRYLIKQFYIVLLLVLPAILNTHDPTFSLPSTVRIKSDRQKILSNHEFVFFGHVDFLVSEQLHVFADRMFFDSDINCIRAEAADDGVILLQDGATTILAQRCFIDIKSGEVNLYNACIQGIEGFLAVKYLYRDTHGVWRGDDVSYTPCDAPTPHWQIVAKNVQYDPLLLKLKNINFLINQSVVGWVPVGVVPLRRESHSGFLLPRFMLDYRSGIGVRQDYYWYIHEHADVTTGIDWKNGRGIFGTGEIRWAGNARHNGYFKGYGGYAEHIYVQRKDSIVQTGKPQYWIEGTHSYGIDNFVGADYVSALTMLDNGTDKKIGFEFFDNLEAIDDTFYNGLVIRAYGSDRYFQGKLDTEQTSRKNFSVASANRIFSPEELSQFILENPSDKAVQEFDNRSNISHRPHFFYADLLRSNGYFSYKNFYMTDYALMREQETERIFLSSQLAREERIIPRAELDSWRFESEHCFALHIPNKYGTLYADVQPRLSIRSHVNGVRPQNTEIIEHSLLSNGAYRGLIKGNFGYMFPAIEWIDESDAVLASIQPHLYVERIPFIEQRAWPLFDRFDRLYPARKLGFFCNYSFKMNDDVQLRGYVQQSYDEVRQPLWFLLDRTGSSFRMTPFKYALAYAAGNIECSLEQELCLMQQKLLTSFLHTKAIVSENEFQIGYLFQDLSVGYARRQLAKVPHAFFIGATFPLGRQMRVAYNGFFVAEKQVVDRGDLALTPIKHEVRLEYRGHCWGFYIGFEEKLYRQYSFKKQDRSFILSIYMDSLGSFAKKIKSNNDVDSRAVLR